MSSELYTHVNLQKLIEGHRLSHPAKRPLKAEFELRFLPANSNSSAPSFY